MRAAGNTSRAFARVARRVASHNVFSHFMNTVMGSDDEPGDY